MTSNVFKSFQPTRLATIVLLLLTLLFATLGTWQAKRAAEKEATEQMHQSAMALSLEQAIDTESRFSRVSVNGYYDENRHILLDNQIWQGRAGVYVFTPFYTDDGLSILINRGWLPLGPNRQTMPGIPTTKDRIEITGMLNHPPVPGRILGSADKLERDSWPQLVTYLKLTDISDSLDLPLQNWIVQLSGTDPSGFEGRVWKPVFLSSDRHNAYSFQWFALAFASIIMWLSIGFRKSSKQSARNIQ